MGDCHACIKDDDHVSRHHFILEACPPQASLRDLGSLNGTFVNGKVCGGRKPGETPEQGAKRSYPEIELKHGNIIRVGRTDLQVGVTVSEEKPDLPAPPPELKDLDKLTPEQLAALLFQVKKAGGGKPLLQLPGYRVEKEIGRGGFGAAYRESVRMNGVFL